MSGKRSFFDPNGPHRREKITGQKTKWKMIERKVKNDSFFHAFCSFSILWFLWTGSPVTTKRVEFFRLKRKTRVFLELEKIECIDELLR